MTIKEWLEREKKKDEIFEAEAKTADGGDERIS